MDRWTERFNSDGAKAIAIHDGSDFPDVYFEGEKEYDAMNAFADYEDLEEQGLLVRLPCNVGDTVFRINEGAKNPIIELTVTQINIIRKSYNLEVVDRDGGELMYFKNDIGNSIFLTREEAENKLEEMKKNDNRKKN